MNDQRRPPRRPQSSRSLRSYTGADAVCHLNIDHRRYRRDWYYRALVNRWAVEQLLRYGEVAFDFDCEGHDLAEVEAWFVEQVSLDLPVGMHSLEKVA